MVRRNLQLPLPQRRLADVQLHVCQHPPIGFRQLIDGRLRHRNLGDHLVGLDAITVLRRRKAIDKDLPQLLIQPARVLRWRKLDQALGIGHLDPHRALVSHAQPTAVAQRPHRHRPQRLRPHRKAAQRRLAFDDYPARTLDRLIELHLQFPLASIVLHAPAEHGITRHGQHFARPGQRECQFAQLALQHLQVHHRQLPQQPAGHPHVRGFRAGEKQRAVLDRIRRAPRQRRQPVGWQKPAPLASCLHQLRHHCLRLVKLRARRQSHQPHRHHHAARQPEFQRPPIALADHRHFQLHRHRKLPGILRDHLIHITFSHFAQHHMPAIARNAGRQRRATT